MTSGVNNRAVQWLLQAKPPSRGHVSEISATFSSGYKKRETVIGSIHRNRKVEWYNRTGCITRTSQLSQRACLPFGIKNVTGNWRRLLRYRANKRVAAPSLRRGVRKKKGQHRERKVDAVCYLYVNQNLALAPRCTQVRNFFPTVIKLNRTILSVSRCRCLCFVQFSFAKKKAGKFRGPSSTIWSLTNSIKTFSRILLRLLAKNKYNKYKEDFGGNVKDQRANQKCT
jgi:hypothetical protein